MPGPTPKTGYQLKNSNNTITIADGIQLADAASVGQMNTALAAKVPTSRTINGQSLGSDLTFSFPTALFAHHVNAGNVTIGETDLYSDTIAAGQLATNDDQLEAWYGGTFVSSATATREIKTYFGGTAIFDTGALTLSLSSAWTMYVQIIRVSSSVVRYSVSFTTEGAALSAYTAVGELTGLTLANTNVLKITGQAAGVGAATNDIVATAGGVNYQPHP